MHAMVIMEFSIIILWEERVEGAHNPRGTFTYFENVLFHKLLGKYMIVHYIILKYLIIH